MKTYRIDEKFVQEIGNVLRDYIEEISHKHPKKASRICKIGSKLVTLPIIEEELKMKTYQINEQSLSKVIEMLDGYSTLVYYEFEIKDLIKELKELKDENLSDK